MQTSNAWRIWLVVLVLANVLLWAWTQGYLMWLGTGPTPAGRLTIRGTAGFGAGLGGNDQADRLGGVGGLCKRLARHEKAGRQQGAQTLAIGRIPQGVAELAPHQGIGDLIEEERFDQSEFYSYLQGFLMIPIYKIDKQDPNPIIGKAFIYYPEKETILKIQTEWEGFRDRAKNLSITKIPANNKNGFYRESNLPAKTEIIHMRPHGRDAMDLDTTAPLEITKHCFWFNKGFIQDLLRRNQ